MSRQMCENAKQLNIGLVCMYSDKEWKDSEPCVGKLVCLMSMMNSAEQHGAANEALWCLKRNQGIKKDIRAK